jgi:hypothetical protein
MNNKNYNDKSGNIRNDNENIRNRLTIGVKITVAIWFIVGISQYIRVKFGYGIDPVGRYLEGRMGPPSITAEASYYGSLSVLQIMCLLKDGRRNLIYICMAFISILISGSLLSIILLIFPLLKLFKKYLLLSAILIISTGIVSIQIFQLPLPSRINDIFGKGFEIQDLFQDASLNLRFGHIYFTSYYSLINSLFMNNNIDFMIEYNNFATNSNIFIETGSDYILPAFGELIYGGGIFGIFILVIVLNHAWNTCKLFQDRLIKVLFILFVMLNPISLSNIFLILYINQREK